MGYPEEKIKKYIDKRIEQLLEEEHRTILNAEPSSREIIRQRFKGRIKELKKFKDVFCGKRFERRLKEIGGIKSES